MAAFLGNIWRLALVRHAAAALAPRRPAVRPACAAVSRGRCRAGRGPRRRGHRDGALAIVTAVTRYLYSRSTTCATTRGRPPRWARVAVRQAALGALYLSFGVIYAGWLRWTSASSGRWGARRGLRAATRCCLP